MPWIYDFDFESSEAYPDEYIYTTYSFFYIYIYV